MADLLCGEAHATGLSGPRPSKPYAFYNWRYAKALWLEKNTRELAEAEWKTFEKDFDPWLEMYEKNSKAAMKALKSYPKAKRERIQRGHDAQIAYDDWAKHIYVQWYKDYYTDYQRKHARGRDEHPMTFDELLVHSQKAGAKCGGEKPLTYCAPPDWRSPEQKADDQRMMKQVASCVSCNDKHKKDNNRVKICRPTCKGLGWGW